MRMYVCVSEAARAQCFLIKANLCTRLRLIDGLNKKSVNIRHFKKNIFIGLTIFFAVW